MVLATFLAIFFTNSSRANFSKKISAENSVEFLGKTIFQNFFRGKFLFFPKIFGGKIFRGIFPEIFPGKIVRKIVRKIDPGK
jgi:hypothetical protein